MIDEAAEIKHEGSPAADAKKRICFYGSSHEKVEAAYGEQVEQLGRMVGERGCDLVFGGCGTGLMGRMAAGVRSGGGKVYGVITNFIEEAQHPFPCDDLVVTHELAARKELMEARADAFIVAPGGLGTWDEYYEIMTLKMLGQLDKPIAIYNINGYYDTASEMLAAGVDAGFITPDAAELCRSFADPEALLDYLDI